MTRRSLRTELAPAYQPQQPAVHSDEPQLILKVNEVQRDRISVYFDRDFNNHTIAASKQECLDALQLSPSSAQAHSSIEVTAILDAEKIAWSLESLAEFAAGLDTLGHVDTERRCKILTVKLPDDPAVLPIDDLPTNAFTLEAVQTLTWESHRNQLRYMLGWSSTEENTNIYPNLTTVNITCVMTMHDCTYILSALAQTLRDFEMNYLMENGDMTVLESDRIQEDRELDIMVALERLILHSELDVREMVNKFRYRELHEFKVLKPDEEAESMERPEYDYHTKNEFRTIPRGIVQTTNLR